MFLSDASIAHPEQTRAEDQNEPKYVDVAIAAVGKRRACIEGW
jgi:hypothetical protein